MSVVATPSTVSTPTSPRGTTKGKLNDYTGQINHATDLLFKLHKLLLTHGEVRITFNRPVGLRTDVDILGTGQWNPQAGTTYDYTWENFRNARGGLKRAIKPGIATVIAPKAREARPTGSGFNNARVFSTEFVNFIRSAVSEGGPLVTFAGKIPLLLNRNIGSQGIATTLMTSYVYDVSSPNHASLVYFSARNISHIRHYLNTIYSRYFQDVANVATVQKAFQDTYGRSPSFSRDLGLTDTDQQALSQVLAGSVPSQVLAAVSAFGKIGVLPGVLPGTMLESGLAKIIANFANGAGPEGFSTASVEQALIGVGITHDRTLSDLDPEMPDLASRPRDTAGRLINPAIPEGSPGHFIDTRGHAVDEKDLKRRIDAQGKRLDDKVINGQFLGPDARMRQGLPNTLAHLDQKFREKGTGRTLANLRFSDFQPMNSFNFSESMALSKEARDLYISVLGNAEKNFNAAYDYLKKRVKAASTSVAEKQQALQAVSNAQVNYVGARAALAQAVAAAWQLQLPDPNAEPPAGVLPPPGQKTFNVSDDHGAQVWYLSYRLAVDDMYQAVRLQGQANNIR